MYIGYCRNFHWTISDIIVSGNIFSQKGEKYGTIY